MRFIAWRLYALPTLRCLLGIVEAPTEAEALIKAKEQWPGERRLKLQKTG